MDVTNNLPFNTSVHFHGIEYDIPPYAIKQELSLILGIDRKARLGQMGYQVSRSGPSNLARATGTTGALRPTGHTGMTLERRAFNLRAMAYFF